MSIPILYQGSGGTIGDLLLSSHCAYYAYRQGRAVTAAIPQGLRPELLELYRRQSGWLATVELPDITAEPFLEYASRHVYDPSLYLIDRRYTNPVYAPLWDWLRCADEPTLERSRLVGIHVTSGDNYPRPKVPQLLCLLDQLERAGYSPVFIGSARDEDLFRSYYPGIAAHVPPARWRFGSDSLLQTLANLACLSGMLTFSSWTAYGAALQGVPTLELWSDQQWGGFSNLVCDMLGRPPHYRQCHYCAVPRMNAALCL